MILADTSVWIEHFRRGDERLRRLLLGGQIVIHPFVIGELVLGGLSATSEGLLTELPRTAVASHDELMHAIASRGLARRGIGYVDAHLIAALLLTSGVRLWTRDAKLGTVAGEFQLAAP